MLKFNTNSRHGPARTAAPQNTCSSAQAAANISTPGEGNDDMKSRSAASSERLHSSSASRLTALFLFMLLAATAYAQSALPVTKLGSDIEIREIQPGAFVVTHCFPWPANSLFVLIGDHDLVFVDTPYTPEAADLVLDWIFETFGHRDIIEINTGFHFDNLGGNQAFIDRNIPVYGSDRTAELIGERGEEARKLTLSWLSSPENTRFYNRYASLPYIAPDHLFPLSEGKTLTIGSDSVEIIFPGETHTPDNIVVYFPQRKLLFGGCMILAGNGPGNTADANLSTWKNAVIRLLSLDCRAVVPGHGLRFDAQLIQNTINALP
jgi:metallo-beta-lactamase class B